MVPTFGAFDIGCSRILTMLAESGRIEGPVLHKVFLSEGWAVGPLPSVAAMELHVAELPDDLDVEWIVVPYSSSDAAMVEQLARAALDRGGHVRGRHRRQPERGSGRLERRSRGARRRLGEGGGPAGGRAERGPSPPGHHLTLTHVLFAKRFWDGLADGGITVAFRRWKRPTVKAGGTLRSPGWLPRHRLGGDRGGGRPRRRARATRAGYADLTALRKALGAPTEDRALYRVEFHLAGTGSTRHAARRRRRSPTMM